MGILLDCFRVRRNTSDEAAPLVENSSSADQSPSSMSRRSNRNSNYYQSPHRFHSVGRPVNRSDFKTSEEYYQYLHRQNVASSLPVWSAHELEFDSKIECPICISYLEPGELVKALPCTHLYHQSCIDGWLLTSLICPICMANIDESVEYS